MGKMGDTLLYVIYWVLLVILVGVATAGMISTILVYLV